MNLYGRPSVARPLLASEEGPALRRGTHRWARVQCFPASPEPLTH